MNTEFTIIIIAEPSSEKPKKKTKGKGAAGYRGKGGGGGVGGGGGSRWKSSNISQLLDIFGHTATNKTGHTNRARPS